MTLLKATRNNIIVAARIVERGGLVGRVGSTGWSTGPHLHFEIRINGAAQDPMGYLP